MEKIPTVKEFMQGKAFSIPSIENMIIEFAKLHVEAALKEAGYAADTKEVSSCSINEMYRENIKQSYPLENIK